MPRHIDHGRQADATEIEITPEMIEAGVGEMLDYNPEDHAVEEIVIKILHAALRARL
jgi:hypothetical protein